MNFIICDYGIVIIINIYGDSNCNLIINLLYYNKVVIFCLYIKDLFNRLRLNSLFSRYLFNYVNNNNNNSCFLYKFDIIIYNP
jgi:hypothetical protein